MKLHYYIARRYLFSKKSSNAINLITWISIIGIAVGAGALIIVLSVFNGLTQYIENLYGMFDPDIKIVAAEERYFDFEPDAFAEILASPNVKAVSRTIEGEVLFKYFDNKAAGLLKGVETDFPEIVPLHEAVYDGDYKFDPRSGVVQGIFGYVIQTHLTADRTDENFPIDVLYIPQGEKLSLRRLPQAIRQDRIFPAGTFNVQSEYDAEYVITDFGFVQNLIGKEDQISAFEVKLEDADLTSRTVKVLQKKLGKDYKVLDRYGQHETLYKVMRNEKLISYLILTLMLVIAAVNIVGSLSMIVLEKTRDISILKSMGMRWQDIRKLFLLDGLLIGTLGGGIGMALAFIFYLLQISFGLVKLQGGATTAIEAFPIKAIGMDFFLVFMTVIVLALIAALYPSYKASQVGITQGLNQ